MPEPRLVRDHVPELIAADGGKPQVRTLSADGEFREALLATLRGEVDELAATVSGHHEGDLLEELADVLEVLRALADCENATWAQVERAATSKRFHRGGFHDRVLLLDPE